MQWKSIEVLWCCAMLFYFPRKFPKFWKHAKGFSNFRYLHILISDLKSSEINSLFHFLFNSIRSPHMFVCFILLSHFFQISLHLKLPHLLITVVIFSVSLTIPTLPLSIVLVKPNFNLSFHKNAFIMKNRFMK